jgi:hypothetical protein
MRAARLREKGYSQSEVARRVGAHRQSVSHWAAELQEKGRAGLKRAGRKPGCHRHPQNRAGIKAGSGGVGLYHQSVDLNAGGPPDRDRMRGPLSSGPCLAHFAAVGVELPTSGRSCPGTHRGEDPAVEAEALAGD